MSTAGRRRRLHLLLLLPRLSLFRSVSKNQLNKLRIIHVTGTKGKGSTCAMTESILRSSGYSTGLFTSPHLWDVRERIRVNGRPVDKRVFITAFDDLWASWKPRRTRGWACLLISSS